MLAGHGDTLQAVEPRCIDENTMSLAMVGLEEARRKCTENVPVPNTKQKVPF